MLLNRWFSAIGWQSTQSAKVTGRRAKSGRARRTLGSLEPLEERRLLSVTQYDDLSSQVAFAEVSYQSPVSETVLALDVTSVAPASMGQASVVGRHLFYSGSRAWNVTSDSLPGNRDDNAIAPDKIAYLPGNGVSTFASVSSYSKGITGIMVDLARTHGQITADDFVFRMGNDNSPELWQAAPAPLGVVVRAGAGLEGADRIELIWADNAIQKTWLQVTLRGNDVLGGSNTNTGLAKSDVFFFGNGIGDSGKGNAVAFSVDATDELSVRNDQHSLRNPATITNVNDFNRDRVVDITDQLIARNNRTNLGTVLNYLDVDADPFPVSLDPTRPEHFIPSWEDSAFSRPDLVDAISHVSSTGTDDVVFKVPALSAEGLPLIGINSGFILNPAFAGIDGRGFSTVIIDSGIDLNHPFFGPDIDRNGIADRIVFSFDFSGNNDPNAGAPAGQDHGSGVTSIIASQDAVNRGVAPGTNIIHLKVFPDGSNSASMRDIEEALRWVVANAGAYNISSVNLSLGAGNVAGVQVDPTIGDELNALARMSVIVVASAGNDFAVYGSAPGVSGIAADPNALAVGAVYDANVGTASYANGATDYTTSPDRIASFSQRHTTLTDVFAPGPFATVANATGGTWQIGGTSAAAPYVSGAVTLAQQLAGRVLGRRLSMAELTQLFSTTGAVINDGDDENDNVVNTGADFRRLDVNQLLSAIIQPTAIGGTWLINGKPTFVSQSGNRVTFVNEFGSISEGTVAGIGVTARDWGNLRGTISGNSIQWNNGTVWTDVAEENRSDFSGSWTINGLPTYVSQDGNTLRFVNESGDQAIGQLITSSPIHFHTSDWRDQSGNPLVGSYYQGRIQWSNGTEWTDAPDVSSPTLAGTWMINGRPTYVSQNGGSFTFTNENGQQSSGRFLSPSHIEASDWSHEGRSLRGTIVNGQIQWTNGTTWSDMPETPRSDFSGTWEINGLRTYVSQVGGALTFINEAGSMSSGEFVSESPIHFKATGWGNLVGSYYDGRIHWSNGTVWTDVPDIGYANLNGTWAIYGHLTDIRQDGLNLRFTNEGLGDSSGYFISPTHFIATDWNIVGALANGQISWSNGTVWTNVPDVPNLAGGWQIYGMGTSISQDGIRLSFTNENGSQSSGYFLNQSTVVAAEWGNLIGDIDANLIRWRNGTVWQR